MGRGAATEVALVPVFELVLVPELNLEVLLELPAPAELQQPILRAFSSRGFLFSC